MSAHFTVIKTVVNSKIKNWMPIQGQAHRYGCHLFFVTAHKGPLFLQGHCDKRGGQISDPRVARKSKATYILIFYSKKDTLKNIGPLVIVIQVGTTSVTSEIVLDSRDEVLT